jgi:hypothetical protein
MHSLRTEDFPEVSLCIQCFLSNGWTLRTWWDDRNVAVTDTARLRLKHGNFAPVSMFMRSYAALNIPTVVTHCSATVR